MTIHNFVTTYQANKFKSRFPGPFNSFPGSDGVDDTFDIICLTSDERVASVQYWDEVENALLISRVVSAALNAWQLTWDINHELAAEHLRDFRQSYPGPYACKKSECEYYGPIYFVYCEQTNSEIMQAYNIAFRDQAKLVTLQLVDALNHM